MWHQKLRSLLLPPTVLGDQRHTCHPAWEALALLGCSSCLHCTLTLTQVHSWTALHRNELVFHVAPAEWDLRRQGWHKDGHSCETSALLCRMWKVGEDTASGGGSVSNQTGKNQWRLNRLTGSRPPEPVNLHVAAHDPLDTYWHAKLL